MGKVLIMSTPPQPSGPPESERPAFGPQSPFSTTDMLTLQTGLDVIRALGRIEHTVEVLERANDSHRERQSQVDRKIDKVEYILSNLQRANVSQGERLGGLEKEFYAGKVLGGIIVAGGILLALAIYLVHRLAPFFPK